MDFGLQNKIALVTAATRGLGYACASQLAAEGCRVAICSRDKAAAEETARSLADRSGSQVAGFGADVSQPDQVQALLAAVRQTLGDPQILITNAGGPPPGTYASTAPENYEKALQLNLLSGVNLIRGVTDAMIAEKWGRIIAITSISVKQPIGNLLLSNMARAGLTGFLKTVATELAPHGITVNALLPGTHKTDRVDQLVADRAQRENKSEEAVLQEMMNNSPNRRIGDPMDFGAAAAFLASNQAKHITGHNLLIDGGAYAGLL